MRHIIFIALLLLLVSCSSKKNLSYNTDIKSSETVRSSEESVLLKESKSTTVESTSDSTETVLEVTEVDFISKTDSVSGKTTPIVSKIKTTKQTTKKAVKSNSVSGSNTVSGGITKNSIDNIITSSETVKLDKSSKFSNTAIERLIYLGIALIVGGYLVIKKYFPSIFVKLIKFLLP